MATRYKLVVLFHCTRTLIWIHSEVRGVHAFSFNCGSVWHESTIVFIFTASRCNIISGLVSTRVGFVTYSMAKYLWTRVHSAWVIMFACSHILCLQRRFYLIYIIEPLYIYIISVVLIVEMCDEKKKDR